MFNYREKKILEILDEHGEVKVKDLSKLFQVSEVTIRRDLQSLENQGLLVRTHGGAQKDDFLLSEIDYNKRVNKNVFQKKLIANGAIKLIKNNSSIYLDAGSTVFELAKLIVQEEFEKLTIVTNDLHIAKYIYESKKYNLIMLGGIVNKETGNTEGYFTRRMINDIYVDIAFIGVSCISKDMKIYTPNEEKVGLKKLYFQKSNKTVVLVDQSKFEKQGMFYIEDLGNADIIITNKKFTNEELKMLGEKVKIHTV